MDENTCAERCRRVADDPKAGEFRACDAISDDRSVAFRRRAALPGSPATPAQPGVLPITRQIPEPLILSCQVNDGGLIMARRDRWMPRPRGTCPGPDQARTPETRSQLRSANPAPAKPPD